LSVGSIDDRLSFFKNPGQCFLLPAAPLFAILRIAAPDGYRSGFILRWPCASPGLHLNEPRGGFRFSTFFEAHLKNALLIPFYSGLRLFQINKRLAKVTSI